MPESPALPHCVLQVLFLASGCGPSHLGSRSGLVSGSLVRKSSRTISRWIPSWCLAGGGGGGGCPPSAWNALLPLLPPSPVSQPPWLKGGTKLSPARTQELWKVRSHWRGRFCSDPGKLGGSAEAAHFQILLQLPCCPCPSELRRE